MMIITLSEKPINWMIQGKVLPATFPRIKCYRLLELTNKQDKCQIVIVIYNG